MPAAVPAIVAAVGAGASIYGADKNAKAVKDAQAQNAAAIEAQNAANYQRWLESKGVDANGNAINAKLPRYWKWNSALTNNRMPNTFSSIGGGVVAKPSNAPALS